MKKFIYIILICLPFSCGNQIDLKTDVIIEDNSLIANDIYSCNLDKYIEDSIVSKLAKDIYLGNEWDLSNDTEALALLDSLTAINKSYRPFYFKVVTKTYKKSDGYFSEGLGFVGAEYVKNNSKEFASYFDNLECFTNQDLSTWVDIVMLELGLVDYNEPNDTLIKEFTQSINCTDCSNNQKETILRFVTELEKKWNKLTSED